MRSYVFDLQGTEGSGLRVLLSDGRKVLVNDSLQPYFYIVPDGGAKKTAGEIEKRFPEVKEAKVVTRKVGRKDVDVVQIFTHEPKQIPKIREDIKEYGEPHEDDIHHTWRYLIDKDLYPMRYYDFEIDKERIRSFKPSGEETPKLRICAFDIETYNKTGISQPDKDSVLLVGYCDEKERKVFSWKEDYKTEKEMLRAFVEKLKKEDADIIVGYNSGGFDFPYLSKRFKKLGLKLDLGRDGSDVEIRRGWLGMKADIFGRVHLDAYDGVEFLTGIGAMRLPKNDLPSVYREFFGKEKVDIEARDIWRYWEEGGEKLKLLEEYNRQDAMAAYEIGKEMLPLVVELSRIVGLPAYEISRMSAAQMVEQLLVREAHRQGVLTPKRISEDVVRERLMRPIKGAFVKLPQSGLHENIVVCDFKSLYPSIIISHNIGPDTYDCDCCKGDGHVAPEVGHRFCKKKKGLLPKILAELIDARTSAKAEMKRHDKKSNEYRALHFKQWGLKIIANAAYGYQGYARARWYSREAAESTTAWARHYIHQTISEAEKAGFEVLYADTDSCFLKLGGKSVEDAKAFVDKINASLPERMELEFQGFYPRGVFVTRRMGGAAKKKYALIREDGTVEIKILSASSTHSLFSIPFGIIDISILGYGDVSKRDTSLFSLYALHFLIELRL